MNDKEQAYWQKRKIVATNGNIINIFRCSNCFCANIVKSSICPNCQSKMKYELPDLKQEDL